MGKAVAPWRVGLVLNITEGDLAGFVGTVVFIEDSTILMVDEGTRETHWFEVHELDAKYGTNKWFNWIESAGTPLEVINDLIADWDREDMGGHYRYQDVVSVLKEARNRIQAIEDKVRLAEHRIQMLKRESKRRDYRA